MSLTKSPRAVYQGAWSKHRGRVGRLGFFDEMKTGEEWGISETLWTGWHLLGLLGKDRAVGLFCAQVGQGEGWNKGLGLGVRWWRRSVWLGVPVWAAPEKQDKAHAGGCNLPETLGAWLGRSLVWLVGGVWSFRRSLAALNCGKRGVQWKGKAVVEEKGCLSDFCKCLCSAAWPQGAVPGRNYCLADR